MTSNSFLQINGLKIRRKKFEDQSGDAWYEDTQDIHLAATTYQDENIRPLHKLAEYAEKLCVQANLGVEESPQAETDTEFWDEEKVHPDKEKKITGRKQTMCQMKQHSQCTR